jgi:hypothetical protein
MKMGGFAKKGGFWALFLGFFTLEMIFFLIFVENDILLEI